jgi:hypothetical protein
MSEKSAGHCKVSERGCNNYQKSASNPSVAIKKKKLIINYYCYFGSTKQASDYTTKTKFIINHIKKTFHCRNNIAKTIRTLQLQDTKQRRPKLQKSEAEDKMIRETEQEKFKMEYKAELDVSLT